MGELFAFSHYPLMERVMGIEPTSSAWKAEVLPLNYTRLLKKNTFDRVISLTHKNESFSLTHKNSDSFDV